MMKDGGYEVEPGPSIHDLIWHELDACYAKLMELKASQKVQSHEQSKLMGICAGLASAIAIIRNPYDPDEDVIREEVAERYAAS